MILRNLEKHQKYKTSYRPNEIFWGIGVEHETYIETSKLKQITLKELKDHRAPERYSVNYYNIYDTQTFTETLDGLFEPDQKILIPILINSHTFIKTDLNGEHKTTYERVPKPNQKFNGKTIFEWIKEQNPDIFDQDYDKSYTFDGDTVEFMTQEFYKAKVFSVINELSMIQKDFMRAFNSLPREGIFNQYGPFKLAQKNYPFASYLTNLKNNAMFNNGTLHINITLPTQLNEKAEIADFDLFTRQHQNYARAIQWISPLLVAKYGAHDPLCESKNNSSKYSAGSQRVAVSRYIGLGTYDTDKMEPGKILTMSRDKLDDIDWYHSLHKRVDYKFLNELGMDINFNKHHSHGIEFRILESLPLTDLHDILNLMVYLADFSLNTKLDNPKKSKLWHFIAEECVHNGKGYLIDVSDQHELYKIFNMDYLSKEPIPAHDVLDIITEYLSEKYSDSICVRSMIYGEDILNISKRTKSRMYNTLEFIEEKPEVEESSDTEKTSDTEKSSDTEKIDAQTSKKESNQSDEKEQQEQQEQQTPIIHTKKFAWCC
jgi:hypothetical protein